MTTTIEPIAIGQELPPLVKDVSQRRIDAYSTVRARSIHTDDAWARAKRISAATLDGTVWLPEIGKATHYHAHWVHPRWVRTMHKLSRIGVHTFYRPRRWGDGADAPSWGSAQAAAEAAAKM